MEISAALRPHLYRIAVLAAILPGDALVSYHHPGYQAANSTKYQSVYENALRHILAYHESNPVIVVISRMTAAQNTLLPMTFPSGFTQILFLLSALNP